MKLTGKGIFILIIFLFILVLTVDSFQYRPKARLIPLSVGLLITFMCLIQLINDIFPTAAKPLRFLQQQGIFSKEKSNEMEGKNSEIELWKKFFIVFLWLIIFCTLLYFISYLIVVPLFLFLFIWLGGKERILLALSVALGMFIFLYVLFEVLLQANLS